MTIRNRTSKPYESFRMVKGKPDLFLKRSNN
jgi:hypothetical protein